MSLPVAEFVSGLSNGHVNGLEDDHEFEGAIDASFTTKAIHVGQQIPERSYRPVIPPIYLSSTYELAYPGQDGVYDYSRSGNPTRECLEQTVAALEGAEFGVCYSSGLAALTSVSYLLKTGDHVVCGDDSYGGTNRFFTTCASRMGIELTFCDPSEVDNVHQSLKPNTKLVWLESPTNPTMKLCNISAIAAVIKKFNEEITFALDNTFMSSYFQKPLTLGADLSVQSLTKYINGHSDVVMGAVMTNSSALYSKLKYYQNALGAVPSPFDCFLVKRGLKTLELRMKTHQTNAIRIANYLDKHKLVSQVLHPSLKSHPQRALALKQCSGFSGMVSFYIIGGKESAVKFVQNLKLFKLAVSLGGIQSLVEVPHVMSHASVNREHCLKLGITDSLVRLSVGIENTKDLINDLKQAFAVL